VGWPENLQKGLPSFEDINDEHEMDDDTLNSVSGASV
jgi:hypothetical protein